MNTLCSTNATSAAATVTVPAGPVMVTATARGIVRVEFTGTYPANAARTCSMDTDTATRAAEALCGGSTAGAVAQAAAAELHAYFTGDLTKFTIPLDPSATAGASRFRRSVWEALLTIGYGQTVTYGQLASLIGSPKAARAVGGALNANPVPVIVPCHRVVAAAGIGGFAGPLELKQRMLDLEQRGRPCA